MKKPLFTHLSQISQLNTLWEWVFVAQADLHHLTRVHADSEAFITLVHTDSGCRHWILIVCVNTADVNTHTLVLWGRFWSFIERETCELDHVRSTDQQVTVSVNMHCDGGAGPRRETVVPQHPLEGDRHTLTDTDDSLSEIQRKLNTITINSTQREKWQGFESLQSFFCC